MYLGRSPVIGSQKLLDSIESQFNGVLTTFNLRYGGIPTYPTLSAGVIVSLGGVLQEPGQSYTISSDKIVFSEAPQADTDCWMLLYSQFGSAQVSAHSQLTGLAGDDHTQYLHSTVTRTGVTAEINTTGKITTTSSLGVGTTSPNFISVNANSRCLSVVGDGTTLTARGVLELRNPIADASGITLGTIYFVGSGTGNFSEIRAVTSGSGGANGFGNELRFATKDDNGVSSNKLYILSNGNVAIGTNTTTYKLEVNGSFAATTKSFVIPHPTKPGYRLRHGSLEGPENGVYVRGRSDSGVVELPEYWVGLVDPESITAHLTPIGQNANIWVERIADNKVYVGREDVTTLYSYVIFAERTDVERLEVEIPDN
jgi:hypothetical protein